jgi:hypothetical protein
MRKGLITAAAVAAVAVGTAGTALAVTHTTTGASNTISGCIKSGVITYVHPRTATLKCPAGTTFINWNVTGPTGHQGPSGVVSTKTTDLGPVASVATGGGFVANATQVGTITLKAGTYLLNLNAKATPNVSNSVEVFPEFFVYNQAANPSFAGDLFNVGSGSLAENNTNIDSYFSGSGVITLASATTLHVYAFGYDSDRGSGSYTLDDLAVTATQITPGS